MYATSSTANRTARHQYTSDRLDTASNATILCLCFERLDRDLAVAVAAMEEQDHFAANEALGHAQDLVGELAAMLDPSLWEHASSLLSIYDYVLRLLARANILKAPSLAGEARRLLAEIGEAFTEAARTTHAAPHPATGTDGPSTAGERWSVQA